jgi:hypothetical protein
MTYAIYGEIHFPATDRRGALLIRKFSELKIESSWKSLTDMAEITLPRNVRDIDRYHVSDVFHEGDPVRILFGYDGNLVEEFTGYISQVPAGIPLVIKCEDEMYKLKRQSASVSLKNASLKSLLKAIAPDYEIACDETTTLGSIRYEKQAVSQILEDLKKQGIYTWFEGKTLHAFTLSNSNIEPVKVVLEKTAGESLNQKAIEEVLVVIRLLRKVGKALKVEWGEKASGKHIKREYSGISMTENEMLAEAKKIYNQAKQPGLDGDVTLFGIPSVKHGYRIDLKSVLYPEKDGRYFIDSVSKTVGKDGIRQVCKLGMKAT